MPRLKLYLTYDGSRYKGWQRQTNTRHTIQEIL
ncbi:MAG: tRNA pseudouridine(38-40) synthase TruA, partial [Deltaproteobacteria bacterium]|nr:tRNA pseudouridine(38-40) synthase TruA [Deltaproteobacteria bacterium]